MWNLGIAIFPAFKSKENWASVAERGGYPVPALLKSSPQAAVDRNEIFAGYTQTYLERDLRDLAAVDSLVDFQRLMRAVCLRLGDGTQSDRIGTRYRHAAYLGSTVLEPA